MGKFTRRSGAALLAGAMVLTPLAAHADDDSMPIIDGEVDVVGENAPEIWRFAGSDRVTTAVEAAERTNGVWGNTVIIANTQVFADALAAAPLADVIDAPVLLSNPGSSISAATMAYINDDENGVENVILVGGRDVFTEAAHAQLDAAVDGEVSRVQGANRYQTAVELAIEAYWASAANEEDPLFEPNIFLASGTDFPDALAAGAAAANHGGVVLLTKGDEGLDSYTFAALSGALEGVDDDFLVNAPDIIAIGHPAADAAEAGWLADPVEVDQVVAGANRYETAVLAATAFEPAAGYENFVIASGEQFPDAVVGGAYAANVDGPLLLTQENNLPRVVENFFAADGRRESVENIMVFGGNNSVAPSVSLEVANLPWDY